MDALIRATYTPDRLRIERLSGDTLPIDRCYINLAVVLAPDHEGGIESDLMAHESAQFTLLDRLRIIKPTTPKRIQLKDLFQPHTSASGMIKSPRRILIRGRAGIGKTTLCKKIIHDFTQHGMWSQWFDRILWIPLRNLKLEERRLAGYSFRQLFEHEYFYDDIDKCLLADELYTEIKSGDKTLFLLDGLDEIHQHLNGDMRRFSEELLSQPNVIVTSRPHAPIPAQHHDLVLETIGFYPEQVDEYLEGVFSRETGKAKQIQLFLQDRPLVRDLVRIPIQLDALCYTFDKDEADNQKPTTMTSLYRATEMGLWKKDAVRLETLEDRPRNLVTAEGIRSYRRRQLENRLRNEIHFLEHLAFAGLHNNKVEFDAQYREAIPYDFQQHHTVHLSIDEMLARLSFLRTSGFQRDPAKRSYHFLHLTFQEYFAARYFVRHWNSDEDLAYLQITTDGKPGRQGKVHPSTYLGKYKYDRRYDIFWRFVTGLLQDEHDESVLNDFFQKIEGLPRDMLGPAHQRLVMHCLSEVVLSDDLGDFLQLRHNLEDQLKHWLVFDCLFGGDSHFGTEMEFPDRILDDIMANEEQEIRDRVIHSLVGRPRLPPSMMSEILSWLGSGKKWERSRAVSALLPKSVPDYALKGIVALLKDSYARARTRAASFLHSQWVRGLPESVALDVITHLKSAELKVRKAAARALGVGSRLDVTLKTPMPDAVLLRLAELVHDEAMSVAELAARVLASQPWLPESVMEYEMIRMMTQQEGYDNFGRLMLSKSSYKMWRDMPEASVNVVVELMEHPHPLIRETAATAWPKLDSPPSAVILGFTKLLKDKTKALRNVARKNLNTDLESLILLHLSPLLSDPDASIQGAAVQAFQRETPTSLPEECFASTITLLENPDKRVQAVAAIALARLGKAHLEVHRCIVAFLHDASLLIKLIALEVLTWPDQSTFMSEAAVKCIVELLQVRQRRIWKATLSTLARIGISVLPNHALHYLVGPLQDRDESIRRIAVKALKASDIASLPEEVLQCAVALLKDGHPEVQSAASDLFMHSNVALLPETIIQRIVTILEEGPGRREASVSLNRRNIGMMPKAVLHRLAALLKHRDARIQSHAFFVLEYFDITKLPPAEYSFIVESLHASCNLDPQALRMLWGEGIAALPESALLGALGQVGASNHHLDNVVHILLKSIARSDKSFSSLFLKMNEEDFVLLYDRLVWEACNHDLTLTFDGTVAYIHYGGGTSQVLLDTSFIERITQLWLDGPMCGTLEDE
jgi:HEAT repeat protein